MSGQVLLWIAWGSLAAFTLAGAIGVLLVRETMRLIVSLGAFLLGVAGLYLFYSMSLLAAAQIFLYVGGVLVLFLFAIMALRRGGPGGELAVKFDLVAMTTSVALFAIMVVSLLELGRGASLGPVTTTGIERVGSTLLGSLLPHFEIVGVVLLVALVAALAIASGGEDR